MTTTSPVLGADTWATNAALIADVARLHLHPDMVALDATYGRGIWWQQWRPHRLHTIDLTTTAQARADFRRLPFADDLFDLVAYDPPYAAHGGRATSTTKDYNERAGPRGAGRRPRQPVQACAARVARPPPRARHLTPSANTTRVD